MKARFKILTLLIMLLGSVSAANAADRFFVDPLLVEAGKSVTLDFQLDNENPLYGFQTEVALPAGLTLRNVSLDGQRTDSSFDMITNTEDGKLLIAVFSNDHSPIKGSKGTLMKMEVEVATDFEGGYLNITNSIFVGDSNKDVRVPDSSTYIGLYIPVTDITLNKTSAELKVGEELSLIETIYPENATDKTVSWTSSNPSVAKVDANGHVTALALGEAIISVSCGTVTAICKLTVVPTPVASIKIDPSVAELEVGESTVLIATVIPEDATDKNVTWNSSNPEVAIVDDNGTVTAISAGETNITATCDDVSATCKVIVTTPEPPVIPVIGITLDKDNVELEVGQYTSLLAIINPDDATDKTVTWTSGDNSIADVDANGNITAIALGKTIITATCGNVSAKCSVSVVPTPVTGISLTNNTLTMRVNKTAELLAIVRPDNATDKSVIWSSSNEEVATVDQNGIVTSNAVGTAIIIVTSVSNPEVTAECIVTVEASVDIIPVRDISIIPSTLDLTEGETYKLTATIAPEDATDKTVTWRSSDRAIATVSEDGTVTAVAGGSATIYASSSNGLTAECLVTVSPLEIPVTSISLSNTELLMREGYTAELIAIIRPENASDKSVVWTSSDESIATVDQNGLVTAIKAGFTTVTATAANGSKAECAVTVVPVIIPVESITLNKTSLELEINETFTLIATISPEDATDKTVTWRSSDKSIATVSADGVVTAVSAGTATIYASSSNGLTAECAVTVNSGIIEVISIALSNTELLMREGYTSELFAIILPENATDKSVTWTSSDESIANVDQNGVVTAIKQGVAVVTATASNGAKATCTVTVVPVVIPVESISLDKNTLDLDLNETYTLIATILPEDATDKSVTWRSSDRSVATVSEDGTVTAVGIGTAVIYASSSNGLTAECVVTVDPEEIAVMSISLSNSELLMVEGETAELIAIVRPDNATDKSIIWTSTDESIATVDQNGIVTAVKAGITTITATASNGVKAECSVTVVPLVVAVESITIDKNYLELEIEETYTLTATILPENATDKSVTWRSSDRSIATVSDDGTVTGISAGQATIYASSSNGLTAECLVTVKPGEIPVEKITLSNTELLMREGYSTEIIAIVHPDNATDKRVVWTSSDESIATVDDKGLITINVGVISANESGTVIITTTSVYNPAIKAECVVTVEKEELITAVEGISLNKSTLELEIEDTYTLIATITPEDATDKSVTWRSSDPSIATVSADGVVTGVSAGTTTIYASSSNGLTAECVVTVLPGEVEVISIALSNTELLMREGFTAELFAIIRPENATDKSVVWTSSDESIVTVDQNGVVTAIKPGVAVVTATAANGAKATCTVTVVPVVIPVESITLNRYTLDLDLEETFTLIATILPEDATDKTVTWRSSDRAVATVSENGLVTAVGLGKAIIYASSSNGLTAECVVTVDPEEIAVTSISLSNSELLMIEGDTAELIAIVRPDNATDKTVVWTSSDESIATVDQNGVVTAIKPGQTTITATTSNGAKDECLVTVVPLIKAVESITLDKNYLELEIEETYTLIATILPEDATDKSVTWRSSDMTIATVSADGMVTGISAGQATVYASSSNGLTAECLVTVKPGIVEVLSIALSNSELLMIEGDTADLIAIVRPDNATDKSVVWSTTDETIATVDQTGIVTAVKVGYATIIATASNGAKAECAVTVMPRIIAVEGIYLSDYELNLIEEDTYLLTATILPDNASDKSVTWKSSDKEVAIVDQDGLVTAIKTGTSIIYASSSNGLTAECRVNVYPKTIEVISISLDKTFLDLLEEESETLTAIIDPKNATDKTVIWTSSNPEIATVEDGVVTGVAPGAVTITATASNGKMAYCRVVVYARPMTPKQLLRKGDGTTSTFVTLMEISDSELDELGYRFVYGYTDAYGESIILDETPLRYTHTTPEIYNDPTYDFWVFAVFENEDGLTINSNLRHLDGREEICFNTSKFGYATKGSTDVKAIFASCSSPIHIAIYTPAGEIVFSKTFESDAQAKDEIETQRFTPGIYLLTATCGSQVVTKKIIVK